MDEPATAINPTSRAAGAPRYQSLNPPALGSPADLDAILILINKPFINSLSLEQTFHSPYAGGSMKLADTKYDNKETGCCARLDEARWDAQEFVWNDKPFVKDHIREFLYIPLNFGSVMARDQAAIEQAQAYAPEPLWLVDKVSPWGSDVYIATDRIVPDMQTEYLSGTFMTKVYTGPFGEIGAWITQTEGCCASRGRTANPHSQRWNLGNFFDPGLDMASHERATRPIPPAMKKRARRRVFR